MSARARLDELFTKIDGFFARVRGAYPDALTCHAGCSDCCRRSFSVTATEAEVLEEGLAALSADDRRSAADRAARDDGSCPLLDESGRCVAYTHRPVICRTHGLAIRFDRGDRRSLPMIDACEKNFRAIPLDSVAPDAILDQTTVSTLVAAIDAARAAEASRPRGERIEISSIVRNISEKS